MPRAPPKLKWRVTSDTHPARHLAMLAASYEANRICARFKISVMVVK